MTTLRKGMTVNVTTVYTAAPVTPVLPWETRDFIPWDGENRVMFGFTGPRGGPRSDYSVPYSDRLVCNQCVAEDMPGVERVSRLLSGEPGILVPATSQSRDSYGCQACGRRRKDGGWTSPGR